MRNIEVGAGPKTRTVLSREFELKLDLSDFGRGGPAQRRSSYNDASRNRILVPNEIRKIEGYNPLPGGDKFPEVPSKIQQPSAS